MTSRSPFTCREPRVRDHLFVRAAGGTVPGTSRDRNEDRFSIDNERELFIVADGVGGEQAGEVASELAIQLLGPRLRSLSSGSFTSVDVLAELKRILFEVNGLIQAHRGDDRRLQRMGTTVALALCRDGQLYTAGLGDSRVYLIRGGQPQRLTVDHTFAQALVDAGILPADESKFHPYRNVLHKFLGCDSLGDGPCLQVVAFEPFDNVLLATDGLTDLIEDELLAKVVCHSPTPEVAVEQLLNLAGERGRGDDIACIVAFVEEIEARRNSGGEPRQRPLRV